MPRALRFRAAVRAAIARLTVLVIVTPAVAEGVIPAGFVYLRDVAPDIVQDMRYAGPNNFTGNKLPGYDAAECILIRDAARALARAQTDLVREGLSLKVYDCYRPLRAVAAMMDWVTNGGDANRYFYPRVTRAQLVVRGYIATRSSHSLGVAVDVTLTDRAQSPVGKRAVQDLADCTAAITDRSLTDSVDMGTEFDCFDIKSHVDAAGLTAEQRRWRRRLHEVMSRHGFKSYSREWWHFSWKNSTNLVPQDFTIVPRSKQPGEPGRP